MTRPVALRILTLALAIGLSAQALLFGNLLGVNAPILTAALLGAAYLLRPADRRIDRLDLWLPPAALAISLGIAVRSDPFLLLLDVMATCALLGASVAAIAGEAVTRRSAARVVELGLIVLGWAGIGILRVASAAGRADPTSSGSGVARLPAWAGPVARGLVIAIPLLVIFGNLFSSADVAFDRLMSRLFTWNVDLGEIPIRLTVAFLIAWGVAGLLAVASGGLGLASEPEAQQPGEPLPQSLGAAAWGLPDSAGPPTLPVVRLGAIESATVLIAVDVLFGLFVLLQLTYLFGGQDTLAATGLPYAEYARSGFFQLVWVAVLAGALLATVHAIAVLRTAALVGAGLVLAGLTAVVLASALLRLRIYQEAYGWTELRFYVLATIVWLAIGIGITVVLLARNRMRWLLHGLAISAIVVLAAINVVGPQRLIAEQNVARVLDPSLVPPDGRTGLDVGYAERLGDDAVPALVAVLPALDEADRAELTRRLLDRKDQLGRAEARAWPSWNLAREAARAALAPLHR